MARPREFNENAVLEAAMDCFWSRGYEATSVRDLINITGLTGASLYNAFGDKRALYRRALDHYVERSIAERIRRCETMEPRAAIDAFFQEIMIRSLEDHEHKGCMLVNAALDVAPHDPEFQEIIAGILCHIEEFFKKCLHLGQTGETVNSMLSPNEYAKHLLGVLMGIRVLARVRPERALLEGVVQTALAPLAVCLPPPAHS